MVTRQLAGEREGSRLAVCALRDLRLGDSDVVPVDGVGPVTVIDRRHVDAALERGIVTGFRDGDGLARLALGLDPAAELVEALGSTTVRPAELVVARGDRLTDDTLAQADGVRRTIDNDLGRGLADAGLVQRGFELDEAILERTITAQSCSDVLGDDTLECAVLGGALTDLLLRAIQGGGLEIDTVESVGDLEAVPEAHREGGTLFDLVTRVIDADVQGGVHGVLVSVTALNIGLDDLDAARGGGRTGLGADDAVVAIGRCRVGVVGVRGVVGPGGSGLSSHGGCEQKRCGDHKGQPGLSLLENVEIHVTLPFVKGVLGVMGSSPEKISAHL